MNGTRNFLGQKHTLKHLKAGEIALTQLAERNSWETWEDKFERKQIADHAEEEAERILREHHVPPLDPHQEKELDKIMAAAEKEMVKKR
jgi:trimethylamine--corrinoid protein Co-methyltransferase